MSHIFDGPAPTISVKVAMPIPISHSALASARRAVALGPNDPGALANLGVILAYSGEPTEAIAVTERALRLSPSPPPIIRQIAGVVFYIARQYDRAIEEMRAVSAALPAAHAPHVYLAAAYAHLGKAV